MKRKTGEMSLVHLDISPAVSIEFFSSRRSFFFPYFLKYVSLDVKEKQKKIIYEYSFYNKINN